MVAEAPPAPVVVAVVLEVVVVADVVAVVTDALVDELVVAVVWAPLAVVCVLEAALVVRVAMPVDAVAVLLVV